MYIGIEGLILLTKLESQSQFFFSFGFVFIFNPYRMLKRCKDKWTDATAINCTLEQQHTFFQPKNYWFPWFLAFCNSIILQPYTYADICPLTLFMWVNPLGLAKHNTAASSFSSTPSGMGEEKSKTKNKKLVGQDKNGLINGGEVEEERKNTKKVV